MHTNESPTLVGFAHPSDVVFEAFVDTAASRQGRPSNGEGTGDAPRTSTSANMCIRILADDTLASRMALDRSIEQLRNVASLDGIVSPVIGMPDMHEGYGFPIGGVAATPYPGGIISPGAIGFDINCGVRLLASSLSHRDVSNVESLLHECMRSIPTGYGRSGRLTIDSAQLDRILEGGAREIVRGLGLGLADDLDVLESGGCMHNASSSAVSTRAKERGCDQLGTLGGGNHFLEIQRVQTIFDSESARVMGLFEGQVTVLIHTGSRGLGHQVCTDYVQTMDAALAKYGLHVPDRQLAFAPLWSPEGQSYFAAMNAAANFAFANRQVLTHRVRQVFASRTASAPLRVVYDVAHNIAKIETHEGRELCVYRKGATRAFGANHTELPVRYASIGQPVLIPGSMGTSSFVLVGLGASSLAFASACHGAGRAMSRGASKRLVRGSDLRRSLEARGIAVRCPSNAELAEEAPAAYKDVERVVDVVERAGLARKVARLVPLGVLKG